MVSGSYDHVPELFLCLLQTSVGLFTNWTLELSSELVKPVGLCMHQATFLKYHVFLNASYSCVLFMQGLA